MKYFISSDYHISHANILKYCGRTLFMTKKDLEIYNSLLNSSEEEQRKFIISKESLAIHDKAIIRNHNERVNDEDIVIFLGDFCFRNSKGGKEGEGTQTKALELLKLFKGRFVFIAGNHDKSNSLNTPIISCKLRYGNRIINCVHNPNYVDMDTDINFCGHVHENWKYKRIIRGEKITDVVNCGVDVWCFRPITMEEALTGLNRWKKENNYK